MEGLPRAPATRRRDLRAAAGVALTVLVVFNANLRSIGAGDTNPARYLPFGILRDGSLTLDRLLPNVAQGYGPAAYWMFRGRGGHSVSLYPVTLPVLATPLYVPAAAYLHLRGTTVQRLERVARVMEKGTASVVAAATTGLVYLLLRRRAGRRLAVALAVVFALGTTTWVVSSQAMWQHGLGQLLAAAGLLLVTGERGAGRSLSLGAVCGLLASNRPPDAVLAAALLAAALPWGGRLVARMLAAAAVPVGLTVAYNLAATGNMAGGYGVMGSASFLQHDLAPGLAGLLVSPTKGLLVFCPFLLVVPLALRPSLRAEPERRLTLAISAGIALQLLLYAKADWRGGWSWGPRYLTDLLPFLFWLLPPAVARLSRAGRLLFAAGCGAAIAVEAVGAFWYTTANDRQVFADERGVWVVSNAPFLAEPRHGPAPPELFLNVQGALEGVEQGGGPVSRVSLDEAADVVGWTLTGRRTPHEVVVLVDGVPVASTGGFFARPDPLPTVQEPRPSGWRVPLPMRRITPGEHLVAVQAKDHPNGSPRYVGERLITFTGGRSAAGGGPADPLEPAALHAAAALRARQAAEGYWPTLFTSVPRFERPAVEMNTYLTAVLVDLLGPVPHEAGLEPGLARARRHLSAQIEPGGLVRYHGLPDAPTIGTLGCAITPDADDTALVWRVAPGEPAGLRDALSTLREYRTPDGLYRTWLAPRHEYRCLDPGRDPNPADATNQMHVLMLLAGVDPGAARELHTALSRRIVDPDLWVYYRTAPLVPILRRAELARAGYPIDLPAERSRASVLGQEPWVKACELLARFLEGKAPGEAETLAHLQALADDGFALLRRSPPLLYHNDLSASVSRYYWSEDFGYAVWLRLRSENERRR